MDDLGDILEARRKRAAISFFEIGIQRMNVARDLYFFMGHWPSTVYEVGHSIEGVTLAKLIFENQRIAPLCVARGQPPQDSFFQAMDRLNQELGTDEVLKAGLIGSVNPAEIYTKQHATRALEFGNKFIMTMAPGIINQKDLQRQLQAGIDVQALSEATVSMR